MVCATGQSVNTWGAGATACRGAAIALAVVLCVGRPAGAQEFSASGALAHAWSDNVTLSRDRAVDHALVPSLRVGVDVATYWTVDYEGVAEL